MKELVEVMAKALVEHPEEVSVIESEQNGETVIELKVAPSDMGKVIGKQGRIAKSPSFCCEGSSLKRRQKSSCGNSVTYLQDRRPF